MCVAENSSRPSSVPAGRAQRGADIFEKAACLPFQKQKVTLDRRNDQGLLVILDI